MPMRCLVVEALRSPTSRPNRVLVVSRFASAGTTWASAREAGASLGQPPPWSMLRLHRGTKP